MSTHKGSFKSLLPLIIFVALFIGTGLLAGDFNAMPITVAAVIASVAGFFLYFKEPFKDKLSAYLKGAAQENIVLIVVIFLLSGAFSGIAGAMGAVDSTVNMGLTFLPSSLLLSGIFIICCFVSLSMGTSMGTVVAIAPIAIGIADQTDIGLALALATVIGGSMFGDNLSFISDTTIVATRTQGVKMIDKFKVNFWIVLPGALLTVVILYLLTADVSLKATGNYDYNFIEVLPYLAVLIIALLGVDVIIVLLSGAVFAGILGLFTGAFDVFTLISAAGEGIAGMQEIAIITILIAGMIGLVSHYGGITYLLDTIMSRIKTKKGAELGIASLVSVTDVSTANNTISI
ncbi:MAG: Na+/H+ antiporter NhaC family protein, partial [Jeotgalicoccus sp.]